MGKMNGLTSGNKADQEESGLVLLYNFNSLYDVVALLSHKGSPAVLASFAKLVPMIQVFFFASKIYTTKMSLPFR